MKCKRYLPNNKIQGAIMLSFPYDVIIIFMN